MDGCLKAKNGGLISATMRRVEAHVQRLLRARRHGRATIRHGAMLCHCHSTDTPTSTVAMDGGPSTWARRRRASARREMRQREVVAHEEGPLASRRVRPGRDAHTEPSRLHRGAQRNVSIEPRPWTETVKPSRAPETEGTREQGHRCRSAGRTAREG